MESYQINEGCFLIPQGMDDETAHVLGWPPVDDNSSPFSLTINREKTKKGNDLSTYVARQLQTLKMDLQACQILMQRTRVISGLPAQEVEFVWISDGDKISQRQAYVIHKNKALTFTGTMMEEFTSYGIKLWEKILSSFQFREDMK